MIISSHYRDTLLIAVKLRREVAEMDLKSLSPTERAGMGYTAIIRPYDTLIEKISAPDTDLNASELSLLRDSLHLMRDMLKDDFDGFVQDLGRNVALDYRRDVNRLLKMLNTLSSSSGSIPGPSDSSH